MTEIKNWTEVTKGLYRYVIATNAAYEIHIMYWSLGTDILTAKARLYIVGDWRDREASYFERECLLAEQLVFECMQMAQKDNEKNNG